MIPVEPWAGPQHSVQDQQDAANALRTMAPCELYRRYGWDLREVDALEQGLFTRVTMVASIGNVPALQDLIARGADLRKKSQGDFTALHAAVQTKQLGATACLLGTAVGKELAVTACVGGITPLMMACDPLTPLEFAQALAPVSNLAATSDDGRDVRRRAADAGRSDILSYFDLLARSSAIPPLGFVGPSSSLDRSAVLDAMRDAARDLGEWQRRANLADLQLMGQCWGSLLRAYQSSVNDSADCGLDASRAVHAMHAWRIRVLQRPPLQQGQDLGLSADQRALAEFTLTAIGAQRQRFANMATAQDAERGAVEATNSELLPLAVSLIPSQLALLALQRQFEQGLLRPQQAEDLLAQIVAQAEATTSGSRPEGLSPGEEPPPTLQELRSRFEQLEQTLGGGPSAAGPGAMTEAVASMLKVVDAVQAQPQLSQEQQLDFRRQLHAHYQQLHAATESGSARH